VPGVIGGENGVMKAPYAYGDRGGGRKWAVVCSRWPAPRPAASPVRGATYLATFSAGGRGSPVIDDALTVAANGRSSQRTRSTVATPCSNGKHGVIHDTDTPSSPGQRIAINPNGTFAATATRKERTSVWRARIAARSPDISSLIRPPI